MIKTNRGFTLVELILYLAISTIVLLLAMNLIRVSAFNYTHEKGISEVQSAGRDVTAIMARDIVDAGFKTFVGRKVNNTADSLIVVPRVRACDPVNYKTVDASASVFFTPDVGNFDVFSFKMAKISSNASPASLVELDSVVYSVTSGSLTRKTYSVSAANIATTPLTAVALSRTDILAVSGVEAMKFEFSVNGADWSTTLQPGLRSAIRYVRIFVVVKTDNQSLVQKGAGQFIFDSANNLSFTSPNDKFIRRQYTETVQMENNGL